jgi:hypothetical protein
VAITKKAASAVQFKEYFVAQSIFLAAHTALKLVCKLESSMDAVERSSNLNQMATEIERDEEQEKIENFRDRADRVARDFIVQKSNLTIFYKLTVNHVRDLLA